MYTVYLYSISSSPILLIFLAALCFLTHLLFVSSFSPDFCVLCCLFLCRSLVVACMSTSMCYDISYIHIYINRERESLAPLYTFHNTDLHLHPPFWRHVVYDHEHPWRNYHERVFQWNMKPDLNILPASKQIHARNTLEIWHLRGNLDKTCP